MRANSLVIAKLLAIVVCLYLFIVGIGGMGHSVKLFDPEVATKILTATESPLLALFIGILATSLVQSSSTTTSIIVGMVAGGAISTGGAVFMVMGANIGTTITSMIVSVGHITRTGEFRRAFAAATVHDLFNFMAVAVLFPLEVATGFLSRLSAVLAGAFAGIGGLTLGNPIKEATKPVILALAELVGQNGALLLLVAVLLTFGMLFSLVRILRSLVLTRVEAVLDEHLFKNDGRSMLSGVVVTLLVQSSSITTSLIVPLVGTGVLKLKQVFPYTLGANVGTTMTANLAALSTGNLAAVTVSLAHLLFNLCGIALIYPVPRIRQIPLTLAEWMASAAIRVRLLPIAYIAIAYFGLPFLIVFLIGGG